MNTDETTENVSLLPRWRKMGRKITQTIAILGVGIALSMESGTAQVIISPPTALQARYSTTYGYKKYLWIPQYNIHVLGTATVSDWFMRETYSMIYNMVSAMKNPAQQAKFSGHQALLLTDFDPDLSFQGGSAGSRNTGAVGWSCFSENLVCTTAQDTYNLSEAARFRGWETPVHEFGHTIELTLGLTAQKRVLRGQNGLTTSGSAFNESYAWAIEKWFAVRTGTFRSQLPTWEFNFLAETFSVSNIWKPVFVQRPTKLPVGPLGFTYCVAGGQGIAMTVKNDLAYGANGRFAYLTSKVGTVFFNVATFGYDPAENVVKSGFYRIRTSIVPPPGYTLCADEGKTFILPGLSSVAYGSNGNFKFLTGRTGSVTFNSTTFGGNPNYGSLNSGFYKLGSTP